MPLMPGICFCYAPGLPADSDVLYSLRASSFLRGAQTNPAEVFRAPSGGRGLGGSVATGQSSAHKRSNSGFDTIEFYLEAANVGEYLASPTSPSPCIGMMSNADFTGGSANRHRQGTGQYFVTSREIAQRIMQVMTPGLSVPNAGLGTNTSEWLEIIDEVRGTDSNDWFTYLDAALRGSMNLVVIAYLRFPP